MQDMKSAAETVMNRNIDRAAEMDCKIRLRHEVEQLKSLVVNDTKMLAQQEKTKAEWVADLFKSRESMLIAEEDLQRSSIVWKSFAQTAQ